jgi:hypothetical protein
MQLHEKRQDPSMRKLVEGTILGIIAMLLLFYLYFSGQLIEAPLRILLFIPDQFGLIQKVTPDNTLVFEAPGNYVIRNMYAGEYLIFYEGPAPFPGIRLNDATTGDRIGFKNDDTPPPVKFESELNGFVQSLYRFRIDQNGDYFVHIKTSNGIIRIVPHITPHNNRIILGTLAIEFVLALAIWVGNRRIFKARLKKEFGNRWGQFDEWLEDRQKDRTS